MTGPIQGESDGVARSEGREHALRAAKDFLAATVHVITPGRPASVLLACLTRYRAHLATVVASCSERDRDN